MRVLLLLALLAFQLHSYGSAESLESTDPCVALNTSCEDCIQGTQGVSCYFCEGQCLQLDTSISCPLGDIRVGQCHLSGLALIVVTSGVAFMLVSVVCVLAGLALYCYCRFCRRGSRATRTSGTSGRADTDMREMQERHSQRRAERTARNDETRRKYGLVDEEDTSRYQRF